MTYPRTARLLELVGLIQTRNRFTAAELASEVGVSRRTILRDLQTLEALGIALEATPGPGGGYRVPWGRRRLSLSFSLDEALALVTGYDAVRSQSVMPLTLSNQAITKIRAALPAYVAEQVTKRRKHLAFHTPSRNQTVPCFDTLLDAAMEGHEVSIVYESLSAGPHARTIRPVGLYAEQGLWYCACCENGRDITLRADRVSEAKQLDATGPIETLSEWFARRRSVATMCTVRARLSKRGTKRYELQPLFDRAHWRACLDGCWEIEADIEAGDMAYWRDRFMALSDDARVIAPTELIQQIHRQAELLTKAYDRNRDEGL